MSILNDSPEKTPIKTRNSPIEDNSPIILSSTPQNNSDHSIINEHTHTPSTPPRKLFKKHLKKLSHAIIEKKIKQKLSTRFFDKEAELGSDNEEHDDIVKQVKDSDEEEDEEDNDENINEPHVNIENLINDDIQEDALQKEKFIEDEFRLDKERIKKVIDGPNNNDKQLTKKRRRNIDRDDDNEEDLAELPLHLRIERMNNEKEDNEGEEADFQSLLFNYKKFQNDVDENNDNEELRELFHEYQTNALKKLNKKTKQTQLDLRNRIKEDNQILENVIIKNKVQMSTTKGSSSTNGNGISKQKKADVPMKSFGSYLNKTNSFLHSFRASKEEKEKELLKPNIKGSRDTFIEIGNPTGSIFARDFKATQQKLLANTQGIYSLLLRGKGLS